MAVKTKNQTEKREKERETQERIEKSKTGKKLKWLQKLTTKLHTNSDTTYFRNNCYKGKVLKIGFWHARRS